jgi:DNA-binding CsgD family transcriptional regulator/PAS domain-containing protein
MILPGILAIGCAGALRGSDMKPDARSIEAERLSELIGAIYDCVLDPARWDSTLNEVRKFLDCANVVLAILDLRTDTVRLQKTLGIEPYWLAKMAEHSSDLAKLYRTVPDLLTRDIDEPIQGDREAILVDPYYVEWGRPQGLIDWIALFLMRSPNRFAKIWLARHESFGMITDREVRLLRLLAPHLRRAVTITDLIDMKSLEAEALGGALDTLAVGTLLVADDGAILHANRAAASMLDHKTPIAATRGKLRAGDLYTTDRLRRTIALAARSAGGIGASGIGIALRGPSGDVATAHVLPLARGELRTRLMPRAVAAVFVASDLRLPFNRLQAVAEAFGLTPAETRLLDHLIRGESIADAASAMNVAVTTVKTHRSRLLSKTGARRQTGLISLVHRLVPAVGAMEADIDGAAAAPRPHRPSRRS